MIRLLTITLILTVIHCLATAQEVYFLKGNLTNLTILLKYDIQTCQLEEVYNFKDDLSEPFIISPLSLSFHPDGRLYMLSDDQLVAFNVITKKVEKLSPISLNDDVANLAISEKGQVLITEKIIINDEVNYIDYNLRQGRRIRTYSPLEFFGLPGLDLGIGGFLKAGNLLFFGGFTTDSSQYNWAENSYSYWDVDAGQYDSVQLHHSRDYSIFSPSIYLPPCEPRQMFSTGSYNGFRNRELLHINTDNRSINTLCPSQLYPQTTLPDLFWPVNDVANTTDFRQSPLRIDLDADNSSYHATAGYYDTLTTCRQDAPVVDDDITISTCDADVDYISFRLAYYDEPRLPEEFLTAEGYETDLQQVSPSRWEWHNPYGGDKERIKEFLRSLRYHADWDPDDPDPEYSGRERVVITTMHVGDDSTSSWTIFQLEQDEIYAGRDTLVEYCPSSSSIDLRTFLSEDALAGGRFDPEPSGGGGLFVPGTDQDSEFLYIVESRGCFDTAVLTVQDILVSDAGLDSVYLCPNNKLRIGFPPGKYSDIQWWDGSSGDSIWVQETTDVMRPVNVMFQDKCGLSLFVNILIRKSENLAGPDTTLSYCPAGPEIDLSTHLPTPVGSSTSLVPALQSGGLTFTPGSDLPGTYEYIVSSGGGCADTSLIMMEESTIQELPFEDVHLCSGQDARIGLPEGTYQNVMWWNGETRDSTTITDADSAPYFVEVQKDGCTLRADFDVIIQQTNGFPDSYPDTLELCPGDHAGGGQVPPEADRQVRMTILELDSIELEGRIYHTGDEIIFSAPGNYTLTGYTGGCSTSKTITITSLPDLSNVYSETIYWCEGTPLSLFLPNDSAGLIFSWSDGTMPRERQVTTEGEYPFDILTGSCTFQSKYTVIQNDPESSGEGETEECVVSIPNAVTPNGDGQNDGLEIFLTPACGRVESMTLWDKWGGLRYKTNSASLGVEAWDGLPAGIYMVQVEYENESGMKMTETGSVLVIR